MSNNFVFLVEMVLIFGLVLGWGVWELVKLNRDEKTDAKAKASDKVKERDGDDAS